MEDQSTVSARMELSRFLTSRRGRLTPDEVGLLAGRRRRVPGLRREEVALLAHVSEAWYARLEAGHDINVSGEIVDAIARALRLDGDERAYLFTLTGASDPHDAQRAPVTHLPPAVIATIDALEYSPAVLYGPRWDVLLQNRAYIAVFGDIFDVAIARGNVVRQVFLDPARRTFFADWRTVALALLQNFRASAGRHLDDPSFAEIITALQAESPEFESWWNEGDVQRRMVGKKIIVHPSAGAMTLDHVALALPDWPEIFAIVYTAQAGSESERKLRSLCTAEQMASPLS